MIDDPDFICRSSLPEEKTPSIDCFGEHGDQHPFGKTASIGSSNCKDWRRSRRDGRPSESSSTPGSSLDPALEHSLDNSVYDSVTSDRGPNGSVNGNCGIEEGMALQNDSFEEPSLHPIPRQRKHTTGEVKVAIGRAILTKQLHVEEARARELPAQRLQLLRSGPAGGAEWSHKPPGRSSSDNGSYQSVSAPESSLSGTESEESK